MELEERFEWLYIKGKYILYLDISNTSEKELLSLLYMITDFTLVDDKKEKTLYFMIEHRGGANMTTRFFKETMVFLKGYNCFEKSVGFGKFSPMMIAISKFSSMILKRESKLCKNKEDALKYILE